MNRMVQIRMFSAGWPGMLVAAWVVVTMSFAGVLTQKAYAHGTEKHENKHRPDAGMQHVHSLMSVYEDCFNRISEALKAENKEQLRQEAERLLVASRELGGANPYKQGKQAKVFRKHAQAFEREVTGLLASTSQGDIVKATKMFKQLEQKCLSCHTAFN